MHGENPFIHGESPFSYRKSHSSNPVNAYYGELIHFSGLHVYFEYRQDHFSSERIPFYDGKKETDGEQEDFFGEEKHSSHALKHFSHPCNLFSEQLFQ